MKKILLGACAALMACACNQEQLQQQQKTIDSLNAVLNEQTGNMNLVAGTLSEVQKNLDYIKEKEGILSMGANAENKEQLSSDIQAIYAKMQENKRKVQELEKKLAASGRNNAEYKKVIEVLQKQIEQQNAEIEKLNNMLADKDVEIGFLNNALIRLSGSVDSLATVSAETHAQLDATTNELNTGYYIVAEKSRLQDLNLLEGTIFNRRVLNGEINNSVFTKVDVTVTESIPLSGRRFRVLTNHPESSYEIDKEKKVLIIKNKAAFWKSSKYLIIRARNADEAED